MQLPAYRWHFARLGVTTSGRPAMERVRPEAQSELTTEEEVKAR
jgi:hypothetical protein